MQVYRTAIDSLLSWLSLVDQALDTKLFRAKDIRPAAYWFWKVETSEWMKGFVDDFYCDEMNRLRRQFRKMRPSSMVQSSITPHSRLKTEEAEKMREPVDTTTVNADRLAGR